jgi:hypothetical protein
MAAVPEINVPVRFHLDGDDVTALVVGPQDRLVVRVAPNAPSAVLDHMLAQFQQFWPDLAASNRITIVAAEQIAVVRPDPADDTASLHQPNT